MGLKFISGSTYLMFKGASIVTTAIFSKILFGMIIQKRHYVGCGAAILGLLIVGGSGFLATLDSEDHVTMLIYSPISS
jgi:drug/metabolite transporter (DMT)-like permease